MKKGNVILNICIMFPLFLYRLYREYRYRGFLMETLLSRESEVMKF